MIYEIAENENKKEELKYDVVLYLIRTESEDKVHLKKAFSIFLQLTLLCYCSYM